MPKIVNVSSVYKFAVTRLCDIFDDDELQLVAVGRKELLEMLALARRANSSTNRVATLKESLRDPYGDIAVCTGDESFSGGGDRGHWRKNNVVGGYGD